jgi:hypothetical protein
MVRLSTRVALAAASLAVSLAVSACGSTDDPGTRTAPANPAPKAADTDLRVSVFAPDAVTRRVRCPGSKECARLARLSVDDFKPNRHAICTQQYGGDWTARVQGTLHGRRLATDFSLRNGCEIARWQRFSWLLGTRLPQTVTG